MEIALTMMPVQELLSGLEKRLTAELADEAYKLGLCRKALAEWENEHLLNNPTPELLAQHKKMVDRLLGLGRWMETATSHPDCPDHKTAELVQATLWSLQQMRDAWHRPKTLSPEKADQILAAAFPDEP